MKTSHLLALCWLPALLACDPPQWVNCLVLSPECARGEAELRVDVVNLASDVAWVTASVDGKQRGTNQIRDGAVSLYFFDMQAKPGAKVEVQIQGSSTPSLVCNTSAETGEDKRVTVDARGAECAPVAGDAGNEDAGDPDASAPDAATSADAGTCHREHEDGGPCDGGGCCDDDDGGFP